MSAAASGAPGILRILLVLTAARWFPVGLTIGITVLLAAQRGLDLAQIGLVLAIQGFVVIGLELPTGGLADAIGRRTALLASSAFALASAVVFVLAHSMAMFCLALALQGVFRALDSGPLEAWYVDAVQAEDPHARIEHGLTLAGAILGLSIAAGALVSGGLIAWHPLGFITAIETPYWLSAIMILIQIALVAALLHEPESRRTQRGLRSVMAAARTTTRVVAQGVTLLGRRRVLLALILVEVFWSVGMIAFEVFMPIRLDELVGGQTRAAVLMGPVTAVAWGVFAAGSAFAGLLVRRFPVSIAAALGRMAQGALIVAMGCAAGPVSLVGAFFVVYTLHGFCNPVHSALLHRQADAEHRTTVLSMNSMVSGGSFSVGVLLLGAVFSSPSAAMVTAGAFSILGAALYVPAWRQERGALGARVGGTLSP